MVLFRNIFVLLSLISATFSTKCFAQAANTELADARISTSPAEQQSAQEELVNSNIDKRVPLVKLDFTEEKGNAPIYVKSNTFRLDSKNRVFTYEGNVEAWQDDLFITADFMTGNYNDENRLETIICKRNVVVTKGDVMRANSQRAIYQVEQGTIELTEGPELINRGNALTADKVILYLDEEKSTAEGDVRVKLIDSDKTSISGDAKQETTLKGLLGN
jgi:lipopolysaccharide export system protein LptA